MRDSTKALQLATIIRAAAVLLTKMDKKPVVNITPRSIDRGFEKRFMMKSAIRMCKFHFSIARDIKNPAKNMKMTRMNEERNEYHC